MVLIHFVEMTSGDPRCGQPERANWLWTEFPDDVTCAACRAVVCERRAHPRAGVAALAPDGPIRRRRFAQTG